MHNKQFLIALYNKIMENSGMKSDGFRQILISMFKALGYDDAAKKI